MNVNELIKELTSGLAFWEELYKEECKQNKPLVKQCALHILQLEQDIEEAIAQHPDWCTMTDKQELEIRKLNHQQLLLGDLLKRFTLFEHIVDRIADTYLRHSVAQANASDERLDLLKEAIRQRDEQLANKDKTIDCLINAYVELHEQLVNKK